MNILFIPTWYSAHDAQVMQAGVFHYEQAMALKQYCNVSLYFPFDRALTVPFLKSEERGLVTYRRQMRANVAGRFVDYVRDFRLIQKDGKIDLIHAHVASEAGLVAIFLGKLFEIPVVITEHNPIELSNLDNKKSWLKNKLAYGNSAANICVSKDSMERLQAYFPDCHFSVIYNGIIDPKTIASDGVCYRRDGVTNCCIVAAFYSREIKGYQYLLPAIRNLVDQGEKILLHICGGGAYLDEYRQMAKDLNIEDHCIFYGACSRDKTYSIMSQMDFSISASIFECSGVSVQEAMLLGKPLVVSKSGGANSLVTEETAFVVDRQSIPALTEGIRAMIAQNASFDAEKIRTYAYDNFEIEQVSRRYVQLYNSVLQSRK